MTDLKGKSPAELAEIAQAIRRRILEVVSTNGGHLSSSLGAVDLIVAMHAVFDPAKDPFIFDVSHQSYAHKLLTGRWEEFSTLRQFGGISGYTKPSESPYDYFVAGHSSTSVSAAVGAAKAIALSGESRIPVVLIGDGSMTAGMVYEALNELGERKYPVVIIINDNEMSISKPIGAISQYLSKMMAGRSYQGVKGWVSRLIETMPRDVRYLAKRFDESLKLITPGLLFEELGLEYIGPVNGHDIEALCEVLTLAKGVGKPVVVHTQTTKGKGYKIAEGYFEHWHGVGPFDLATGTPLKSGSAKAATTIFGEELVTLAQENPKVVGMTAAMPSGTGMKKAIEAFPERFWDVAIAEQHAVTSAASLAKEGFAPVCAIYSTFLQRGFDQVIHDVALQNLPVVFALDRAGIVGEDGETHQGVFDVGFLRMIPNMVLFAPRDEATMRDALRFGVSLGRPCAFRYPRGTFFPHEIVNAGRFELGRAQMMTPEEGELLLVGYGNGVGRAMAVRQELAAAGIEAAVLDLRFVKPLDTAVLERLTAQFSRWFVLSDSAKAGGVASALAEYLYSAGKRVLLRSFEYEDAFIAHGATHKVEESLGLLPQQIAQKIREAL